MNTILTRFAPTPSGFLHPGNAFSLVLTWLLARSQQGRILLRIDDLDAARCKPEYVEDIFRSLEWLGLDYDEGPDGPESFYRTYSQHFRIPLYEKLLERLRQQHALFVCTCSRAEVRQHNTDGHYPGTCRQLHHAFTLKDAAWRIRTPEGIICRFRATGAGQPVEAMPESDFIVRRKDGMPAYQVASLADDLHFGVNLVVRGADLLGSTAAQLFLAERLGAEAFRQAAFHHHPLMTAADGHKLSKSKGAGSLRALRLAGARPNVLIASVAQALGMLPPGAAPLETPRQLLELFDPGRLPATGLLYQLLDKWSVSGN